MYHDTCAAAGLSLSEAAAHGVREYFLADMPGAYRRLVIQPQELSWQLLQYTDPDANLAVTELDRAMGNEACAAACSPVDPGKLHQLCWEMAC